LKLSVAAGQNSNLWEGKFSVRVTRRNNHGQEEI
jgi:hypothetical protein